MVSIQLATIDDLPQLMELQRVAFQQVADEVDWQDTPNLHETIEHARDEFSHYVTLKMTTDDGVLVGSIRGNVENGSLYVGRLMVHPRYQCRGYGSRLIREIEALVPHERAWLNTCEQLEGNVRLYARHGYEPFKHERINDRLTRVFMEKQESINR